MLTVVNTKKPAYDSGIDYNGERLHILPASKRLYEQLVERKDEIQAGLKAGNAMEQAYKLAARLLNENTLGVTVPEEDINALDVCSVVALLDGYTRFIKGLQSNPN